MLWKKTIKEIKETELKHYTMVQNRMNKISDYIQGPLQNVIEKAINNYFKDLEKSIKTKNKKDK